jgi:hypothetical protein
MSSSGQKNWWDRLYDTQKIDNSDSKIHWRDYDKMTNDVFGTTSTYSSSGNPSWNTMIQNMSQKKIIP